MARPLRRNDNTLPDGRPVKITLGEMRTSGVRGLLVYCQDYRCSHNVRLEPADVDKWPDQLRLSDLEPRFVCKVCGRRGAILRGGSEPTLDATICHPQGVNETKPAARSGCATAGHDKISGRRPAHRFPGRRADG